MLQVCAGLFCWTGVLGVVGSSKGLISECLVHHRSDTIAAANALGLKVLPSFPSLCCIALQVRGGSSRDHSMLWKSPHRSSASAVIPRSCMHVKPNAELHQNLSC